MKAQRQQQQNEVNKQIGALGQQQATAQSQDARNGTHNYRGIESLAGYSEAMAAYNNAMQAGTSQRAWAAPWEADLNGGAQQQSSPWDDFQRRLTGLRSDGQSLERSRQANRAAADKQKADEAARWTEAAKTKQKFYENMSSDIQNRSMHEEDRRVRAQKLYFAMNGGDWNPGNMTSDERTGLWDAAFRTDEVFKRGGPFSKPETTYEYTGSYRPPSRPKW